MDSRMKTESVTGFRHVFGLFSTRTLVLMLTGGLCHVVAFLVTNENPLAAGANYMMVYSVVLWVLAWFVRMSRDGIAFFSPSRTGSIPFSPAEASRLDMNPPSENLPVNDPMQAARSNDLQPGYGHSIPKIRGTEIRGESGFTMPFPEPGLENQGTRDGRVAENTTHSLDQKEIQRKNSLEFSKDALVAGTVLFLISSAIQYV